MTLMVQPTSGIRFDEYSIHKLQPLIQVSSILQVGVDVIAFTTGVPYIIMTF